MIIAHAPKAFIFSSHTHTSVHTISSAAALAVAMTTGADTETGEEKGLHPTTPTKRHRLHGSDDEAVQHHSKPAKPKAVHVLAAIVDRALLSAGRNPRHDAHPVGDGDGERNAQRCVVGRSELSRVLLSVDKALASAPRLGIDPADDVDMDFLAKVSVALLAVFSVVCTDNQCTRSRNSASWDRLP